MPVGYEIYEQINRPSKDLIARFVNVPTADLADVMNKRGAFSPAIAPLSTDIAPFAGPAITVSVPDGAFETIKIAMDTAQPGDVLVINAASNVNHALLGGNVCRGLKARGLAGLIADGAVRDRSEILEDGLPVFARGLALVMGSIQGAGDVNVPIACGGVVVFPGDIIVADADGIVAIRPDDAEEVLEAALALGKKHEAIQPVLLQGDVTNIAGIRAEAAARGAAFHPESYGI